MSTCRNVSTQPSQSSCWITTSTIFWVASLQSKRSSWFERGWWRQSCSLIWPLWSNWEKTSKPTSISSTFANDRTPRNWLITQMKPLLNEASSSCPVSSCTHATSAQVCATSTCQCTGQTSCSKNSLTRVTWRKHKALKFRWCATEQQRTLLVDRPGSSSLWCCQSSTSWARSALTSKNYKLHRATKTLKSGNSERNMKGNTMKSRTNWIKNLRLSRNRKRRRCLKPRNIYIDWIERWLSP